MSIEFESIKRGMEEAIDFSEGKTSAAKVYKPSPVNVKAVREKVGMTQVEFASAFGISLGTLRHWERGDRSPHGPALVLLNLVRKDPNTILEVLAHAQ